MSVYDSYYLFLEVRDGTKWGGRVDSRPVLPSLRRGEVRTENGNGTEPALMDVYGLTQYQKEYRS